MPLFVGVVPLFPRLRDAVGRERIAGHTPPARVFARVIADEPPSIDPVKQELRLVSSLVRGPPVHQRAPLALQLVHAGMVALVLGAVRAEYDVANGTRQEPRFQPPARVAHQTRPAAARRWHCGNARQPGSGVCSDGPGVLAGGRANGAGWARGRMRACGRRTVNISSRPRVTFERSADHVAARRCVDRPTGRPDA